MRFFWAGILALCLLSDYALAQAFTCNADAAWRRVRATFPIHSQALARCENKQSGEQIIVLTEPPPHLVRARAEPIIKALFSTPVVSVQRRRHQLGFDGWVEDLVITVRPRTPEQVRALADDLGLLALYAFGSAYKAEVEDIARLAAPAFWDAPPAFEVSADELFAWLLGPQAEKLVPLDGTDEATLQQRSALKEVGVYQTATPGLIVALLLSGPSAELNEHVEALRRFAIDTDTFLGALKLGSDRVALVGRERTSAIAAVPPLRVETVLLLASQRSAQLSQSYERNRAFAGKLLSGAGDLFGWDWAPILLSDVLGDTEFGSLLNFTDDMLKSWSESGKIDYKGFSHAKPQNFPFGTAGAFQTIGAKRLTYNWNTAGAGYLSRREGVEIFSVRNTGSLPVSYFPEGSEAEGATKTKLVGSEDAAYRYFNSLRNPMLQRAVQYAALYQVIQAFDLRARPPHDMAASSASITTAEKILQNEIEAALSALSNPSTPTTSDPLLWITYTQFGGKKGQEFETRIPPEYATSVQKRRVETQQKRNEIAAKIAQFDREMAGWRQDYARQKATGREPALPLRLNLNEIGTEELTMVRAPEQVRRAVLKVGERDLEGWIRTPSIVVSRADERDAEARRLTGGHNIGGMATRVEIDASVPKGRVSASGSYGRGRVLRVNPADGPAARDLVRQFDREVGLDDANIAISRPSARASRGAQPSATATQIGYRSGAITGPEREAIAAIAKAADADAVVSRVANGYEIHFAQPSSAVVLAPNYPSMLSAFDGRLSRGATAPGRLKIVFNGTSKSEAEFARRNLETRLQEASGGAGGKPPFGGRRFSLSSDDGSGPRRPFSKGPPSQRQVQVAVLPGKKQPIHADGPGAEQILKLKPQFEAAEVNFRAAESVSFTHAPDFGNADLHVVEVRLFAPEGGRLKRITVDAIGVFSRKLTSELRQMIDAAIAKVFKRTESIELGEALTQYKNLMLDEFKADDIWINLRQEGADVIVTDALPTAAPRG